MSQEPVLGLAMRRRLYETVQRYPGLHVRELARQLDSSVALTEYHLAILRDSGLVRVVVQEGFSRAYASGGRGAQPSAAERQLLAVLRKRLPLRITLYLLDQDGPVPHKRIAEDLGLGKSKLSFHLRKLEAARIVRRTAQGDYGPAGRDRLLQLLLEHEPTPDVKQEFADVWLSLYGDR